MQVWNAYCEDTGRTSGYVLSDARKRLIREALKLYPLPDVLDAVRGWRYVPHNRGENDRRQVYNELDLLLRDAKHIERFRDAYRNRGAAPVLVGHSVPTLASQLAAKETA